MASLWQRDERRWSIYSDKPKSDLQNKKTENDFWFRPTKQPNDLDTILALQSRRLTTKKEVSVDVYLKFYEYTMRTIPAPADSYVVVQKLKQMKWESFRKLTCIPVISYQNSHILLCYASFNPFGSVAKPFTRKTLHRQQSVLLTLPSFLYIKFYTTKLYIKTPVEPHLHHPEKSTQINSL